MTAIDREACPRCLKTDHRYRSLLDTVVLPRWKDVPLREIGFDDLQVWIASLSVDGSSRFEGKGLSASWVRRAHQLIGRRPEVRRQGQALGRQPGRRHRATPAA
jgi:hypothetical protein